MIDLDDRIEKLKKLIYDKMVIEDGYLETKKNSEIQRYYRRLKDPIDYFNDGKELYAFLVDTKEDEQYRVEFCPVSNEEVLWRTWDHYPTYGESDSRLWLNEENSNE